MCCNPLSVMRGGMMSHWIFVSLIRWRSPASVMLVQDRRLSLRTLPVATLSIFWFAIVKRGRPEACKSCFVGFLEATYPAIAVPIFFKRSQNRFGKGGQSQSCSARWLRWFI